MPIQVYTLAEVAKILRIGMATAHRLAQEGRLGGGKVGHGWRFTEEDVRGGIKPVPPRAPRVKTPRPQAPVEIKARFSPAERFERLQPGLSDNERRDDQVVKERKKPPENRPATAKLHSVDPDFARAFGEAGKELLAEQKRLYAKFKDDGYDDEDAHLLADASMRDQANERKIRAQQKVLQQERAARLDDAERLYMERADLRSKLAEASKSPAHVQETGNRMVTWDKNNPAFITAADALKLATGHPQINNLPKIARLCSQNFMRYMTKGYRRRVHKDDFQTLLKAFPGDLDYRGKEERLAAIRARKGIPPPEK